MTTETSIYEYAKQGLAHGDDRVAITFYGRDITYGELFEKIDNVADHLYALGVREGTVVTIHLPNCPQAVMAIYAVAKLGGVCNMVFSGLTGKALEGVIAFAHSTVLITSENRSNDGITITVDIQQYMLQAQRQIQKGSLRTGEISFEALESKCVEKGVFPDQASLANSCALYLHSSGTTGIPKTVRHSHASMNRIVANTFAFLRCKDFSDQIVLGELPLFHGFGLIDNLHDVIAGGGQLIQMLRWNAELAAEWIDRYHVTFMAGVSKIYTDLMAQIRFKGASLTHFYVGGETVDPELKRRFNARMGRESLLYEGYGLAEVIAYCCSCGPFDDVTDSAGSAMPGVMIAVLKENAPQHFGEGELIVASDTMMMGYYPDDDSCFLAWEDKRWLKTGDYARIDPSGHMRFIERNKNVIVRNGFNIFPSEIEAAARSVAEVQDVCVIGVQRQGKTEILAFVEAREGESLKSAIMMQWKTSLPPYAVPDEVRFIDAIPRSMTGKADRLALERSV